MAKNPMIEKMRKNAVDKAMNKGKGKDEEKDEPKDEMPEGGADEAPEEDMAAEGAVPPQVKEALGQLPVPALKAVRAEIDRILAEKGGCRRRRSSAAGQGSSRSASCPGPQGCSLRDRPHPRREGGR